MSNTITLKKGLDIRLQGTAAKVLKGSITSDTYAVKPTDFPGLIPKLSAKVGDTVKAGSPLFYDKNNPEVLYVSPVSGEVVAINRGERRKVLEIVVKADSKIEYERSEKVDPSTLNREDVKERMLTGGVWPTLKMRPYGIVAKPADTPRDIFISCFDSSPIAPDLEYQLSGEDKLFSAGIEALKKLTDGDVHLGLPSDSAGKIFKSGKGVKSTAFSGAHPAGNVGVQIHHVAPIDKGDIVWTASPQDVVMIGRLFAKGKYDATKVIALCGSEVTTPCYYKVISGVSADAVISGTTKCEAEERIISGNVLTGTDIKGSYLGFYDNYISVIPEGNYAEMFGWGTPGFCKYSPSRTFFSWLGSAKKRFKLDTNRHGEERAFVMSGEYEKVLPMDILPVYLLKAVLANDIDKMEQLGIYEVVEEDLALCEYVCTSKIDVQEILRRGIDNMIKELG